jgi:hypothetical protein
MSNILTSPDLEDKTTMARIQEDYVKALPRIQAHAEIHFRGIRDPGRRDDAIANTIGLGWSHWLSAIRHGKDPNEFVSSIADKAVRQVRSGRKVNGQEKAKEVLSPWTQQKRGFKVEDLAGSQRRSHEEIYGSPDGQEKMDAMEEGLKDNSVTPPPDQAAFRTDIPEWLARLTAKKQAIVEDLMVGHSTKEVAERQKVSPGRISQIRREAYDDLAEYAGEGRRR